MSSTTTSLGVLVLLIMVNMTVVKMVRGQPWLFWTIQVLDLAVAGAVLTVGMPGLVSSVKWLVAALFLFHFVQNLQTRMSWQDEARAMRRDAESRERRRQQELEADAEERRRRAASAATDAPPSPPEA